MMTNKTESSILGRRMVLRSVIALLIILLGVVTLEIFLSTRQHLEQSHENLSRRISTIEPNIIQALWRVDAETLRVAVQSLGDNPGVARVSLKAQFRISDIDESFVREGYEDTVCSESIIRDYSAMRYNGLEIGSGVLNICFLNALVEPDVGASQLGTNLIKNFIIASLIAGVFYLLIRASVIMPINEINQRVRHNHLLSGKPLSRKPWDHNDEIDALYNELVEREMILDRANKDEKLRLLGILASGVAHDFNNVLAVIMANADLVRMEPENAKETVDRMDNLIKATHTGSAMVRRLQLMSRKPQGKIQLVSLDEVWENVNSFVDTLFKKQVNIGFQLLTDDQIMVDAGALEAALFNLILNARDAIAGKPKGFIRIICDRVDRRDESFVCICVEDNGQGIPPDLLQKVREPFFTTKSAEGGSGLGLAMVSEFIKSSGGTMRIKSTTNKGTTIILHFPIAVDAKKPSKHPKISTHIEPIESRKNTKILVIDDEPNLAKAISAQLKSVGYDTDFVTDPFKLIREFETIPSYDLVICDVMLGAITGPELFTRWKNELGADCPPFVYISGAIPDQKELNIRREIREEVLSKPFETATLDAHISAVFAKNKPKLKLANPC